MLNGLSLKQKWYFKCPVRAPESLSSVSVSVLLFVRTQQKEQLVPVVLHTRVGRYARIFQPATISPSSGSSLFIHCEIQCISHVHAASFSHETSAACLLWGVCREEWMDFSLKITDTKCCPSLCISFRTRVIIAYIFSLSAPQRESQSCTALNL